jgi:hypothetical protein
LASQRASTNACPIEKIPQDSTLEASWLLTAKFELFFVLNVFFVLILFLLKAIAGSGAALIFQYAPKKFDYELNNTAWLFIVRSSRAFLITGILLHTITAHILKKTNILTQLVDCWIIRLSLLVVAFGYFVIFAAGNTWTLVTGMFLKNE